MLNSDNEIIINEDKLVESLTELDVEQNDYIEDIKSIKREYFIILQRDNTF